MRRSLDRIGLLVHPQRELGRALASVREWAGRQEADVVQIRAAGHGQEVAPAGEASTCDLLIALGGDGTTLAALHAAAPCGLAVLGVACGSLGALTAVAAEDVDDALDSVAAGSSGTRSLPALSVDRAGSRLSAINDLVLVRRGASQVTVEVTIDGEQLIRYAGDGLVAGTPLGSTAYTLAAGGPMLAPGTTGLVLTPLAPHGGVCPPVVTEASTGVEVTLDPGHGGARVEIDGRVEDEIGPAAQAVFTLSYEPDFATLITLGDQESMIAGLRRRRIILDSPRMLVRDERTR